MMKEDTLAYVGSMEQVASLRPVSCTEGQAKGLCSYQVKNGDLSYHVMTDKCLDISALSYKGINMSFLSKPGLQHKGQLASDAGIRSIMGGFLFTAGLENICAPVIIDGRDYSMHGNLRSLPAEHVSGTASWEGDEYVIEVSGEMREAELFGENLLLRRRISTRFPGRSFIIEDRIENQSFRYEAFLLLYHINFGYPFLTERCEILIPSDTVVPRDGISKENLARWNRMEGPVPNEEEYVYLHNPKRKIDGRSVVGIYNRELEIGVSIEYDPGVLPYFMEWKSLGSGDYALGLEPANASVFGREHHHADGSLPMIRSFEEIKIQLKIEILDGNEEYEALIKLIDELTAVGIGAGGR